MAVHSSDSVNYFLSLPVLHKEYLGAIRHWRNLKIGYEEELVWIKDLTPAQVDSLEVKITPHKQVYYTNGPQLFLQGSLLPLRKTPSLLWTPIERGLPIELPAFNHNYFGLNEQVVLRLQPAGEEKEAYACLTTMPLLERYIESASAVRLQNISWAIVDDDRALLLGTPPLPLHGDVYWKEKDFLLPAGYEFELPLLTAVLHQIIDPQNDHWIIWTVEGQYWKVPKRETMPLSIGSFRAVKKI